MNDHKKGFTNLMKAIWSADKYCIRKLLPFCYTVPVYTKHQIALGFKAVYIIDVFILL